MNNGGKSVYSIKIVKFEDVDRKLPDAQAYVIKCDSDGTNYLAELHLVDNDYDLTDKLCFMYDELNDSDKEIFKDSFTTIISKYPDVKTYAKVKSKKKK